MFTRVLCLLWLLPAAFAADLTYSTYLREGFQVKASATDPAGNVYLAGVENHAAAVFKLSKTGNQYLYARSFGGTSFDAASAIAVENDGTAWIVGTASSPDFPVTPGRALGAPPVNPSNTRTFLLKLDPQGSVVFSELLGGASNNSGQSVALAAGGDVVVSGMAAEDFPATTGAYTAQRNAARPYLMKLDSTGTAVRFAAFGIGGSALAVDAAGNIYAAGSTLLLDYPATEGAFQPSFHPVFICYGLCQIAFPATNQYVTKVDAAGAKLLYSTALAGNGQTVNGGLAVDRAGNAYVTGLTYGSYPYTVADPVRPQVRPFLTKLDPTGHSNLLSVPIGGAGIALDGAGRIFVGGAYNNINLGIAIPATGPPSPPPATVNAAPQCQVNDLTSSNQGYVSQVDANTFEVQSTVLVDATSLSTTAIVRTASGIWIAGNTEQADVPISGNTVVPAGLHSGYQAGAYLGLVDFSAAGTGPRVSCILDNAGGTRVTAIAPNQLLTLLGAGLADATVTFDGIPAKVLYTSDTQVNLAVPAPGDRTRLAMEVTAHGKTSAPRQLPVTSVAPNFFLTTPTTAPCPGVTITGERYTLLTQNQDGSLNSCANPAKPGSVVSFFVDGLGTSQFVAAAFELGNQSAEILAVPMINDYVWRVDVRVPARTAGTITQPVNVGMWIDQPAGFQAVGPRGLATALQPDGYMLANYIWIAPL